MGMMEGQEVLHGADTGNQECQAALETDRWEDNRGVTGDLTKRRSTGKEAPLGGTVNSDEAVISSVGQGHSDQGSSAVYGDHCTTVLST